ncbi:MAG TPA: hypothetical protein VGE29_07995 [Prosthecobacter sp.]
MIRTRTLQAILNGVARNGSHVEDWTLLSNQEFSPDADDGQDSWGKLEMWCKDHALQFEHVSDAGAEDNPRSVMRFFSL